MTESGAQGDDVLSAVRRNLPMRFMPMPDDVLNRLLRLGNSSKVYEAGTAQRHSCFSL